jgi:hypothetical protein
MYSYNNHTPLVKAGAFLYKDGPAAGKKFDIKFFYSYY